MILTGTLVNVAAIIVGGLIGFKIKGIREEISKTVMQALALAVILLGMMMGLKSGQFLIIIASLVLGSITGELLKIEDGLNDAGKWLERKITKGSEGKFAIAFVTTTLIYCVGSMAILGSLDSGLRNDHQILFTKAMLDGFSAIIFANTLGIGVIFSAIPVLLYQGVLTLSATWISRLFEPELLTQMINEITAAGGIMIVAIGINMLGIVKIRVASMLPAILYAALIVWMLERLPI